MSRFGVWGKWLSEAPPEPGVYRFDSVVTGLWFVAAIPSGDTNWFEGPRRRTTDEAIGDLRAEQQLRSWLIEVDA